MTQTTLSVTIELEDMGEFLHAMYTAGFGEVVWFGERYALTKVIEFDGRIQYRLENCEHPQEVHLILKYWD